ncbi:MAG: type II secretion system protein GspM [Lentisphaeria bacterium]|nr:type II secretion system protein GspM [Lentisphaeria bacterium]
MDFLRNLSKRERVLLIAAGSCVFLAVVYRLVLIPVREKNSGMDAEMMVLSGQLDRLRTIAARQNQVGEDYVRLKQAFKAPGTDEERVRVFQESLEKFCSETGVRITKMTPRQVKQTDWSKTYLVDLQIEADSKQLIAFLHKLNTADSVYRTDGFHLYRKGKDVSGNDLGASLVVSMLVVADDPSSVAADS